MLGYRLEVYFFDKDKFMYEYNLYQDYKNNGIKNGGFFYTYNGEYKMFNPIDRSWNYWYYKKEIETITYREFEIDRMPDFDKNIMYKIIKFIEIDDDYIWDDIIDDKHYYYSWKSMKLYDETKNLLYPPYHKYNTFEDISDMINRDLKLKELLNEI